MRKLTNKLNGLDKADLIGLSIGVFFILPSIVLLLTNVIVNGSNML